MREIGVRELKMTLSQTLRAVARGQQVRVTLRGRPLADIVPAGTPAKDDRLRRLVAQGRLVAPTRARPTQAPLHLAAALMLPRDDLLLATWDRRLHAAAGAEGLGLIPERLD
jgi:prevent-host-death family protein